MLTDQELIDAFSRGTTDHHHTTLVMRGKRFAIFHIPGRKYFSGRGSQAYARSQNVLIEQGKFCMRGPLLKEWEGRVSKKELRKALDEAESDPALGGAAQ
jgi:hypothetical protein